MLKNLFTWALGALLILSSPLMAGEIPLKQGHPSQYTVQPGDTLWEIAGRFLRHPWYWPEIWYANPAIKNPHLIYPGDVIKLTTVDGELRLVVERQGGTIKLTPQVRVEALGTAVPTIPVSALKPFLTGNRMIAAEQWQQAPYIVAIADRHLMGARGDSVYVRHLNQDGAKALYGILRKKEPLVDPQSGQVLGYHATYVGNAVCQPEGEPATCIITRSNRAVLPGDRLMRLDEKMLAGHFYPKPPEQPVKGVIIAVMGGISEIGRYDVVAINRGEKQGLEIGDVLLIYKPGRYVTDRFNEIHDRVKLPPEQAGSLIVFRTFPRMSFGLIMEATRAISVHDLVRSPNFSG